MRIHYLQHVLFEGPARIAGWVRRRESAEEPLLDGALDCIAERVAV